MFLSIIVGSLRYNIKLIFGGGDSQVISNKIIFCPKHFWQQICFSHYMIVRMSAIYSDYALYQLAFSVVFVVKLQTLKIPRLFL